MGLDIQPDAIRLVKLKKIRHRYHVECIIVIDIPRDIFADGKIRQWSLLRDLLLEVIAANHLHGLPAAINLPSSLVRMQNIQLPYGLSDAEIMMEVDGYVRRDLPGMQEALCIDFSIKSHHDTGVMEVFFAATKEEYLLQYVDCVNATGLDVKVVDVDIHALHRAVSFDLRQSGDMIGAHAMLYITQVSASLIVFDAHEILYHQHWDFSSMPGMLKKNVDLYLATNRITLHKLILGGTREGIARISEDAGQHWKMPVHFPNPFTQMILTEEVDTTFLTHAPGLMIACGLAMREMPR